MYDYLIVRSKIYKVVCVKELTDNEYYVYVFVIEKRNPIVDNMHIEKIESIYVYKYDFIFHTNNLTIWSYVNRFVTFKCFKNSQAANYRNKLYSILFNMYTFNSILGLLMPKDITTKIMKQRKTTELIRTKKLEEYVVIFFESMYMKKIYKVNHIIDNHDIVHDDKNRFVCQIVEKYMLISIVYNNTKNQHNISVMCIKYAKIYKKTPYKIISIFICVFLRVSERYWNRAVYIIARGAVAA